MFKQLHPEHIQSVIINLCALCAALLVIGLFATVGYITFRASGYFWPNPINTLTYKNVDGELEVAYAQIRSRYTDSAGGWLSVSTAQNPYQTQIILNAAQIESIDAAADVAEIRLFDGRSVLAIPNAIQGPNSMRVGISEIDEYLNSVRDIDDNLEVIRQDALAPIHQQLAIFDRRGVAPDAPARERLLVEYGRYQQQVRVLEQQRDQYTLSMRLSGDVELVLPLSKLQTLTFPTDMSWLSKVSHALSMMGSFLSEPPKQGNTAGGIFPALFGTVVMVFLMTILVAPFGVLAAIYLHEYAPNNILTSTIRVCVSNMAAVPSIVYGVFGLGFLVYVVGGNIDALFFGESLPTPTMGTPGIFWAAVTMALLTLPVVIVATEEGLSRVPQGLRRGSYALGATQSETIWYTVLPIASPSIMTGLILAIARAAGEVAPLMLVGAVRFAPNLPLDSEFPFLHLDRQFMHLGVLIYDGAFYSQTSPKGASMMFATCSLLLLVVLILNIVAMAIRARWRERYQ